MIRFRVDDFPGTKPAEFYRHNLDTFRKFDNVMKEFEVSYTLGVIPKYTTAEHLAYFQENPHIAVALHGINHDERFPNEFRDHQTEQDVYLAISAARAYLGASVNSYIPPHNVIDGKTVNALARAGFDNLYVGPETDPAVSQYALLKCLRVWPSFPPYSYGRTDEMLAIDAPAAIRRECEDRLNPLSPKGPFCVTLHWTWETNIGLESLRCFLDQLRGNI